MQFTFEEVKKFHNNIIDGSDVFIEKNVLKNQETSKKTLLYVRRNKINSSFLDNFDTNNQVFLFYNDKCICLPLYPTPETEKEYTNMIVELLQ